MRFVRVLFLYIACVCALPFAFAYIDPGTGGYLISSMWGYIVAFFSLIIGTIAHFFRHTIGMRVRHFKKTFPRFFFVGIFLLLLLLIGLFIWMYLLYNPIEKVFALDSYDEAKNGVQVYSKEKTLEGYTLLEGKLLDMNGEIVQKWDYNYLSFISSDGFYYAQRDYETLEWGKFYLNGTMIWSVDVPIHHEIIENPQGNIVVFSKEAQEYSGRVVEFDTILTYTPDGELLSSWSTWDDLVNLQKFHAKLELDKPANAILPENHEKNESIWGAKYDYYHLNGMSFVPPNKREGLHPAFNPGNWIISFRHGSMVFILDKENQSVHWTGIAKQIPGDIEGQHSPFMDVDGNVIIFDNGRYRGSSRIITVNPVQMSILDSYEPNDFFTYSQGYVQPLSNGNWLVTESEKGRVFELTPQDEVVWEYYYPFSIDDPDDGLVRDDVYRAYRYEKDFIETYLNT